MDNINPDMPGTLRIDEPHPAANDAMAYVRGLRFNKPIDWLFWQESFASTALSGNRLAEICHATMMRLNAGEPVSDRYLLGLTWTLRNLEAGHGN